MSNCSTKPWCSIPGPNSKTSTRPPSGNLKSMLLDGSETFRAFVRPRENNGDVDFVLTEAVIVAAK